MASFNFGAHLTVPLKCNVALIRDSHSRPNHSQSTIEGVTYVKRPHDKFIFGSLNSRVTINSYSWVWTLERADFRVTRSCSARYLLFTSRSQITSHERVCQFTYECHHFSPCEKSKRCLRPEAFSYLVYSHSTILFLENSLKNPPDSFSCKWTGSRPPSVSHFLWNLWKLRGIPRKYPRFWRTLLVSGS